MVEGYRFVGLQHENGNGNKKISFGEKPTLGCMGRTINKIIAFGGTIIYKPSWRRRYIAQKFTFDMLYGQGNHTTLFVFTDKTEMINVLAENIRWLDLVEILLFYGKWINLFRKIHIIVVRFSWIVGRYDLVSWK